MQIEKFQSHSTSGAALGGLVSDNISDILVGPAVDDVEIDGVEIETAASRLGVGEEDVWRRIRNGQLIARTMRGKVFVYTSMPASLPTDLPPTPVDIMVQNQASQASASDRSNRNQRPTSEITIMEDHSRNHEVALLLDHLSLAKEENREILRLTQDSMGRLTQMTDAMLQMKDDVISAREAQLTDMRERLDAQTHELRRALREKEDLETLSRALSQGV